jgi:uncharacterized protein YgiM (DUF1202 family)
MRKTKGLYEVMGALGVLGLAFVALPASFALGAQRAVVDADNVSLQQGPMKNSPSLRMLKKGTPLDVSNFPTEGFYKVRTADKEIGWVQADALDLKKVPAAEQ